MSLIYYDSRDLSCKKPFGAVKAGEQVQFSLRLPKNGEYRSPHLLLYHADVWDAPQVVEMPFLKAELSCNFYSCKLSFPAPQLYFYCFEAFLANGAVKKLCRSADNTGIFLDEASQLWQLTVYRASLETPSFLKGGLIYQIFPDRFFCSDTPKECVPSDRKLHENWLEMPDYQPNAQGKITNSDYFCGDLPGITEKLPYLSALGVTCIYLNPIFEAHSNHRYNTADYRNVDPLLGTNEDLATLCAEGKRLNIRVVLDGVFSHTGDDSIYFNRQNRYPGEGAYNSRQSPYFSWYSFRNWPDHYSSWWDFDTLPNVDELNPDYLNFICGKDGVLHHWLSLGVSGFRLDVADELPDGFLDALTRSVKEYNPEAIVIGEVWEDASNKVSYGQRRRYFLGSQLDSVMNYPFKDAILSFIRDGRGADLNGVILSILENYPQPVIHVLMNCLSTHDVERALTKLVGEPIDGHDRIWQAAHHFLNNEAYQKGRRMLLLAEVLQFFLPGVPSLYYGDELGMSGYRDPFNRCTYPWGGGDQELFQFTKELSALRAKFRSLLCDAPFLPIAFDCNFYAFARIRDGAGLFIAVNRGDVPSMLPLPFEMQVLMGEFHNGVLPPLSYVIGQI